MPHREHTAAASRRGAPRLKRTESAHRPAPLVGLLVVLAFTASGCKGAGGAPPPAALEGEEPRGRLHDEDLETVVLPVAGLSTARISLWLDAGSRDASPPQLAAVAAEMLARRAGPAARAYTYPDGIELRAEATTSNTEEALGSVLRALARVPARPPEVRRALGAIVARRRRAFGDPRHLAQREALSAALGDVARGFFPLGEASGDEHVRAEAIDRFLADHVGRGRAMLVVVGGVGLEEVGRGLAAHLTALPSPRLPRRPMEPLAARSGVSVRLDHLRGSTALVVLPSFGAAHDASRLAFAGSATLGRPRATPVRGGALLFSSLPPTAPSSATQDALTELARASRLSAALPDPPPPSDDPLDRALRVGLQWIAGPPPSAHPSAVPALAVGAVIRGGRGDTSDAEAREARLREQTRERLDALLSRARGAAEISPSRVREGALRIVQAGRPVVGLGLRFEGGPASEPGVLAGRSALLAESLSRQCRDAVPRASVEAVVDSEGFGLRGRLPRSQWSTSLRRLLRCALEEPLSASSIEEARAHLVERAAADPRSEALMALSELLSPGRPSLVWPFGGESTLRSIRPADLFAALEAARARERVRLGLLGPVPLPATAEYLASIVSGLPSRDAAPRPDPSAPTRGPAARAASEERARALFGVRLPAGPAHRGRAFADAWAFATRDRGAHVTWRGGGGGRWGLWAAIEIIASPEEIETAARRALPPRIAERALRAQMRRRAVAVDWSRSRPEQAAWAMTCQEAETDHEMQLPSPLHPASVVIERPQPSAEEE